MEGKVVMNEQRQNVYLNIIQGLLNSRSDSEVEQILNTNEEFIDIGLVQIIQQVAEELVENGNDNAAEFLIGIGRKLAEAMVKSSPTIDFQKLPHPDSQLDFFIPVLQAIIYTNGNPQVIFPLLQQNLDKLDERFVPKFSSWANNVLHNIEGEQAQNFVLALVRFSQLLQYFSYNIRKNDIEVTIACHEIASRVLNRQSLPEQWAAIHNNLAIVYRSRLQGKRAENIESAIVCYEKALEIFTRDSFPERWATIQSNLANAYSERIYGDSAENLEFALACNEKSLQVFTYQDFQENWAITKFNLAVAYRDRLSGSQEENLQRALICCQEALRVYNCNDHPEQWAKIQALMANINSRIGRAENLENAILGYKKALQVYQRDTFAREWAETQCLLGISYSNRLQGERAKNIEDSIVCYESALQVLTRQIFPEDWARTQNNLAVIYQNRLDGTQKENLEHSIKSFQNALLVYQYNNYPKFYTETLLNLAVSYKKYGNFSASYNNLVESIKGVEFLREEIISGDKIKQKIAENYHQIYQHVVEVSLKLNKPIEAIEYVERSKTRNLVELILSRDLKNIFPSQVVSQLEKFRDEIASGQYQLQNATADNPSALAQHLQQLRQQRNELQDQYL
ncbi:tetratricopeptide repeat protein, partial [Nostocales cyanobacterium LEGE 12452]|nr:tetratricopeptide repeat protein [Nostocales cyanobacterium LEGE 12452]